LGGVIANHVAEPMADRTGWQGANLSSATGIEKWLFSGVAAMQVVELQ
jgi:hypothetical protein